MHEQKRWLDVTRSRCMRAMLLVVVKRRVKPALPRSMKQQPSRPYARTPQPSPRSPRPWLKKSADCSRRHRHSKTRKRSGYSIAGRKESRTISQFCPARRKNWRHGIPMLRYRPTVPLPAFSSVAIGSVVLGFFGIAVVGETIRQLSESRFFHWVGFFPISERLNVFTAGSLLALMAVPTIFTLAEDALRNVPGGFKEASYALGANRLQTIGRVIVPASLSGIVSAILLGLGRVIGETMVVLLCAGNRIAIPDFTQGLGAFFQPVHTMTGIIAQEMGEVVRGSIHYRALFMVC